MKETNKQRRKGKKEGKTERKERKLSKCENYRARAKQRPHFNAHAVLARVAQNVKHVMPSTITSCLL